MALSAGGRGAEIPPRVLQLPQLPHLHWGRGHLRAGGALQALLVRLLSGGLGGHIPQHPHPPSCFAPCSGHCYYQMVVTPVIEQILPESPASRIPHTVTLVSIPACSDGKRGFSISIDQGCGTEHPRTVRVRECVPVPSATILSPGLGHPMLLLPLGSIPRTPFGVGGRGVGLGCPHCPGVAC